jgi:hypothetical protein
MLLIENTFIYLNLIIILKKLNENLKTDMESIILEEYGRSDFESRTIMFDDLQKRVSNLEFFFL